MEFDVTVDQARDLAARTLAAIPNHPDCTCQARACSRWKADRQRVASDLAGIERHSGRHRCVDDWHLIGGTVCVDLSERIAGLVRTGALYGQTL